MIFETIILSFIFYMVNYVCKLCTIFLNILIDSGFYHLEFPNLYSWEMLTSMLSFYIFSWCLFLCLFLWYLHSILVLAILIILPVFLWESHSHIWFNLWYYDYFKLILSVQIIKISISTSSYLFGLCNISAGLLQWYLIFPDFIFIISTHLPDYHRHFFPWITNLIMLHACLKCFSAFPSCR